MFVLRYTYFGEYCLGFAAALGQEECVRLLIAKGADPNKQDTNGNTVLHLLVVHDKKVMHLHAKLSEQKFMRAPVCRERAREKVSREESLFDRKNVGMNFQSKIIVWIDSLFCPSTFYAENG